ncbi:MAG: alanine dehydrogenase [Flavobacteriaceae bacterium]|nr:alanine dehydrogenase [Flavobacteriaceae bacterium]|tara:strand:- start:27422 stop:28531 length:1110 start_codon:yes stop_codon:yes gene_type:complete
MKIGVPKEIKPQEARVGLTPAGALSIIEAGHEVRIQNDAGLLSGFTNKSYEQVGCMIENDLSAIYEFAEMIIKVKEPISEEYNLIKPNQLLFTYFHFASSKKLTDAMIQSKAICLAYETVEDNGKLPLLIPMSEVAGRMATQEGAKYLEKPQGGFGILLGGVTGVKPANIMVIGGGVAGAEAALMGAGLGANVTIFDTNLDRLRYLESNMPANVTPIFSNQYSLEKEIKRSHLIIGTVLIPGSKAPKLIKKEMLSKMMPGTVLVDVAIDQGGCFETSEPTTHEKPIIIKEGIIHYAVTNMPGAVPNTSTTALTNATLNYALELANKGWKKACKDNNALARGLNIINGEVVYKEVADAFSLDYVELESIL